MKPSEGKVKKYLILIVLVMFLAGCASVQIKPADQERISRIAGYNSAYWPLKNNPDYIAKVAGPLGLALTALESENVDIADLTSKIIDFAMEFFNQPEFAEYAGPAKEAIRSFRGMVSIDITVPENRENVIRLTRAFLNGAKAAIEDLKAVKK